MKTSNRILIWTLGFVLLAGSGYAMTEEPSVPPSWYQLPENGKVSVETDAIGDWILKKKIEDIYEATEDGINRVEPLEGPKTGSNDPDVVPWRLATLMTQLAISAKGVLAPIAIKGTAAFNLLWKKENTPNWGAGNVADTQDAPALVLTEQSTEDQLALQLEPIIQMAVRAHKVNDEGEFRKNLMKVAKEFYDLSQTLVDNPLRRWWVSRFRFDVWFSIDGKVQANVSVGGEFKLRFEWFRLMKKPLLVSTPPMTEVQENFRTFVENTSEDAESVSFQTFKKAGFSPTYLRLGIGLTLGGNIGVVKIGGGIMGYLYFSTDPAMESFLEAKSVPQSSAPLLLIEARNPSHLAYAKANGIPFEIEPSRDGIVGDIIYKIDRSRFRAGLQRAVNRCSNFAERATEIHLGKWHIFEIRPSFELSIGGDIGIVSIAGVGNIEMGFDRNNFN